MTESVAARVISLPGSLDRRRLVEKNMQDFSLPWQFFDALTGDAPCTYEPDEERQLFRFGRKLTANEVGCFKSHVSLLIDFIGKQTFDWLLVLEDDVWVDLNFDFKGAVGFLETRGINYLRLYARRWKPADVVTQWNEHQLIRFRTDPYGTQAYLINRAGAQRFLDSIQSIDMPIDDEYGRFWRNGLEMYALFPFPVIERNVPSTLLAGRNALASHATETGLKRQLVRTIDYVRKAKANIGFLCFRRG